MALVGAHRSPPLIVAMPAHHDKIARGPRAAPPVPRLPWQPAVAEADEQVVRERWAGYDSLMLVFSLLTIGMLVVGVAVEMGPSSRSILAYADTAVCLVFLTDFGFSWGS
jgi:hypothetical protein